MYCGRNDGVVVVIKVAVDVCRGVGGGGDEGEGRDDVGCDSDDGVYDGGNSRSGDIVEMLLAI